MQAGKLPEREMDAQVQRLVRITKTYQNSPKKVMKLSKKYANNKHPLRAEGKTKQKTNKIKTCDVLSGKPKHYLRI